MIGRDYGRGPNSSDDESMTMLAGAFEAFPRLKI
jgi:hypothetical protein